MTQAPPGSSSPRDETVELLRRIDRRLSTVERRLDRLTEAAGHGTAMAAVAADTMDGLAQQAQASGIDIDARLRAALHLSERLSDPKTMAALERVLEQLPTVESFASQIPGMAATAIDTLDGVMELAQQKGIEAEVLVKNTMQVLDPRSLSVIAGVARSLITAQSEEMGEMGLLGALSTAREPEIRRVIGFLFRFARHFGNELEAGAEERTKPPRLHSGDSL